jgi:uncharacterized protein YceK
MKAKGKFGKLALLAVATSLLSLSTLATAESDAALGIRASAATVPTNIPGIHTYAEPPKGFNPVTATDEELATYGFPPRPDKQAEPGHYAMWERAMKAAKIRWNGELKPLPGREHAPVPAGSSPLPEAVQSETSAPQRISTVNASGVMLTNKQTKWSNKASFDDISTIMTVPTAELPFDISSCTASDYKEFSFVGIDSMVSAMGDSLGEFIPGVQGGVYADVPCGGGGPPFYYAEFGWQYPLSRGFAVNPGDVFTAEVVVSGGSSATAYLEDLTTQTFSSYSMSTPGVIGQNADWIVFRPCCTGSNNDPFPLANTASIFFNGGWADEGGSAGKQLYPGSQASSTYILTMTDDGGDQNIETVNQGSSGYEGRHALFFNTDACAFVPGCTP